MKFRALLDHSFYTQRDLFKNFVLSFYQDQNSLIEKIKHSDILICRSNLKVNERLLDNTHITMVATASSGSDNLDKVYLKTRHIKYFDANGSNAHAVADYMCIVLAWLRHNQGWNGKTAGIIGCGAVGTKVMQRLQSLDYLVHCHDPYKAGMGHFTHVELDQLMDCDLICIHCNYHLDAPFSTHHLINESFLKRIKKSSIIINAARGDIVDEKAMLSTGHIHHYCTDVYQNEPDINQHIIEQCLLATPHIAGHSIEFKTNAFRLVAKKIFHSLNMGEDIHCVDPPVMPCINIPEDGWEDRILGVYNPQKDHELLKHHSNKSVTFQMLRKAHHFRSELNWCLLQ